MTTSAFSLHVERWQSCVRCPLHEGRQHVVLARGKLPCDVLFVGEAPGESEDCLGAPFKGEAGLLLDRIVARALAGLEPPPRLAFTNLVCCIPRGDDGRKTAQPDHDHIMACQPRLREFVFRVAKPKLVVAVGKLAEDYLDQKAKYKYTLDLPDGVAQIAVVHPAAMLPGRANEAQAESMRQRCEIILRDAVEELQADLYRKGSR